MSYTTNRGGLFLPKSFLKAKAKVTDQDLTELNVSVTSEGVDIYDLIFKLNDYYKKVKSILPNQGDYSVADIELKLKQENLLRLRIKNQLLLMELMPKAEAQNRLVEALSGYRTIILEYVKVLAKKFSGDTRENIEEMTQLFNSLVETIIEEQAQVIEWEVDGSHTLLETRLLSKDTNNDLEEMIEKYKKSEKNFEGDSNEEDEEFVYE